MSAARELLERLRQTGVEPTGLAVDSRRLRPGEVFLAWLYNESPAKDTVVTNARWGAACACSHGGFFSCEDRFVPGTLQSHKFESCQTLDRCVFAGWV